jgi:hypothetical protein
MVLSVWIHPTRGRQGGVAGKPSMQSTVSSASSYYTSSIRIDIKHSAALEYR